MSGFLSELASSSAELVDDQGSDWVRKASDKTRADLPAFVNETNRLLPDGAVVTNDQAVQVLDALAAGATPLLRLGSASFAWVVANLDDGNETEAKRLYLETQATFPERRAAMQAAGDAAFSEAKERNDSWEAFKATVSAVADVVGEVALKVLVAFARKAIGL